MLKNRTDVPKPPPAPVARPAATATIDPVGRRSTALRDHVIKVVIEVGTAGSGFGGKDSVSEIARRSLSAYAPGDGTPDRREYRELTVSRKGKAGAITRVVVAVEGSVVWPGRPSSESVDVLCAALSGEGYRLSVQERRECGEPSCSSDAVVRWGQAAHVPQGWFSQEVCGKHNYRRCTKCKSVFLLSSMNAAGQAPSVHCEVCGQVLIEWGSSKIWTAELITRG